MSFGNLFIILTLILSIIMLIFFIKSYYGDSFFIKNSRLIYYFISLLVIISSIYLFYLFIINDFRYAYVYNNSSIDLPIIYKISAFWAGKEGSFLLWLLLLNVFGIFVLYSKDENESILMSVISITQIFILILLILESPFDYIWQKYPNDVSAGFIPQNGAGMNPLLIDPWMIVHPPVLFLGYASSTIPFGYAVSALIKNDYTSLIKRGYKWVVFSMISLGIGIFLGGYWAYKVLGWGGYWGWDPVENSSLIPWMIVVALMHGIIIQKRKGALIKTNIFLSLLYFILVFYSTFLTRSGVLSNFSVHSFGESRLSVYLILFILMCIIVSSILFIRRYKGISSGQMDKKLWSMGNLIVYGIISIVFFSMLILIGTSMPIISGIFMKKQSAVSIDFYNNFSILFGPLIILLMISATMAGRSKEIINLKNLSALLISIILGIIFNLKYTKSLPAYMFTMISIFIILQYSFDLIKNKTFSILPSRLAHIGIAIMIVGIIASNFHTSSESKMIFMNKEDKVGPVELTFKGIRKLKRTALDFQVKLNNKIRDFKTAYYFDTKTNSIYREPYIISGLSGDIYIVPDNYHSGLEQTAYATLKAGETIQMGSLQVKFIGFNTKHMTSSEPLIIADLLINKKKVSAGLKYIRGNKIELIEKIPGTKRHVSLIDIDASRRLIRIYISPDKNTVFLPDSLHVDVSFKRLIWLVWLGTLLISAGGIAIFFKKQKK